MVDQIQKIYNSPIYNFSEKELSPTEYMESKRYIQRHVSERMFGKFDMKNTPYMRQITDHLSPYDPVTHIVLMKGVRIGGTFSLVHNGVPYLMDQRPTNIMLLSANDKLATKTMQGVDNGIDGCGIRHLLGKGSGVQSNSKGDTQQQKFFSGGFELFNFGGQSVSNMRQVTAGVIIADELDAFKGVSKEAGSFLELMEDRARSYGEAKKIFMLSSPLLLDSSLTYEAYLRGNQYIYYVPCPKCGEYVELVWNERNENNTRYGVIFETRNNEVIKKSVRYRCGKCENDFAEKKHKYEMLNCGEWIPSMAREDKNFVSYKLPALYAPVSMDNWYDFAKKYQLAFPRGGVKDEAKFQSFQNSIMATPYKPEGITLKSNKLQKNRREYKIGECPFELAKKDNNGEIILIKFSCDLGGYGPDSEDDARIDWEIEADTEKGATYSIDAGSVGTFIPKAERMALEKEGKNIAKIQSERTKYTYKFDVENSVWTELEEIILRKFGEIQRRIDIACIDIGFLQDTALEFVSRMSKKGIFCIGVKGEKQENFLDQSKTETTKVYKLDSTGSFYLLNVNIIKNSLAKAMNADSYLDDNNQLKQDPNFMNFPQRPKDSKKYTYRNYFAHFEAEHKYEKKSEGGITKFIWEKTKTGIQNHFWDVSVYNKFARILMIDLICSKENPYVRETYKTSQKITANWVNACQLIKESSDKYNVPLS